MEPKTIVMDGAAWLASSITPFTKAEFVKVNLKGYAFRHHPEKTRVKMLEQVYDLAVPPAKKK